MAKSASSVLYCLGRFATSVHVITKWGQEKHEAAGHKECQVCLLGCLEGRTSIQVEHVTSQFVLGGALTAL